MLGHSDFRIVRQFPGARVLVVGDIMMDRYVRGVAQRLSPDAPVPVLRPSASSARLGGAANVAANVAALDATSILVGVVGADPAAQEMAALLGPHCAHVIPIPGRTTTTKTRFLSGRHQLLRVDEETTAPLAGANARAVMARVAEVLPEADIVVLSDYGKGVLSDEVLGGLLPMIARAGKPIIVDPKRADLAAYAGATVLTPNEAELRLATRIDAVTDTDADRAGRCALEMTGGTAILVTRSDKGVTLVQRDYPALHVPARVREVADVSGAGDTLVATLAVALASGASLPAAATLANLAAGIAVTKQGAATVRRAEIIGELSATESKVFALDEALETVAGWRAQGLRIGFTNGCFDLIHPGHVHMLREARKCCDRLTVGLNTDSSVRRLKGPSRPFQSETARATVIASLAAVDLVVLFAEDTPMRLIDAIRPEVLVKGADYRVEQVAGFDHVQSWGGAVVLVDFQEGHSTTATIRRIQAA